MGKSKTTRLLAVILGATALGAAWAAIASGAGPYEELAKILGNGKECGASKSTGCTFNVRTQTAPKLTIKLNGGGEARIECQQIGKGTGFNPGGTPPTANNSVDALELTECKVAGAAECKVSAEAKGLPFEAMATRKSPGGAVANQYRVPTNGLLYTLEGSCPIANGTYGLSGNLNMELVNANEPECIEVIYFHCSYEKRQGENSGKLTVRKEEKEVGSATETGEAFFVCTGGGACTSTANQITFK